MLQLDAEEHRVILNCVKQLADLKNEDVLGLFLKYSISQNMNEQKLVELTFKLTGEWPSTMEH